jgi:hypothetical protein
MSGDLNLDRRFSLCASDILRLNPNTGTAPIFRSQADAELTKAIYARIPILINEGNGAAGNPWGIEFRQGLFNMTSDSSLFHTAAQFATAGAVRDGMTWEAASDTIGIAPGRYVPLYEAKMIHQFDHRWATYEGDDSRDTMYAAKADPAFDVTPRYWVPEVEVETRLAAKGWRRGWLMGWRDICRSTDERTLIASVFPVAGCGDTLLLAFPGVSDFRLVAGLLGDLCCLTKDFITRQKVGGTHLKYNMFRQITSLPPSAFAPADLNFIVPRVLELTYTSYSMATLACDLGYEGSPFAWNEDQRAWLRAELDAYYARLYGLTREELLYILDPTLVKGPDYPSETFRVLRKNEEAKYGEYRTARLIMQAWDELAAREKVA